MLKKRRRVLSLLLTVLSIATATFVLSGVRNALGTSTNTENGKMARQQDLAAASDPARNTVKALDSVAVLPLPILGPVQMVRFTVYDQGIRPAIAHVSPGSVAIYLEDRSSNATGLLIQNAAGATLGQVVRQQGKWRGSNKLILVPGRYQIFDSTRPTHAATLVVAP